jgi:hypothetical protein
MSNYTKQQPVVFSGWKEWLLPLNLNFANFFLQSVQKPVTFVIPIRFKHMYTNNTYFTATACAACCCICCMP